MEVTLIQIAMSTYILNEVDGAYHGLRRAARLIIHAWLSCPEPLLL